MLYARNCKFEANASFTHLNQCILVWHDSTILEFETDNSIVWLFYIHLPTDQSRVGEAVHNKE